MKRFYKVVSVSEQPAGWAILLDGKSIKTPLRRDVVAGTSELADAVMQEWARQEHEIDPEDMPLTQLLNTCIDRVAGADREAMADLILKYLNTDLVCYRTERPADLAAAQEKAWDKWVAWINDRFGADLKTTTGLSALSQDEALHDAVRSYVEDLSDDIFTVLQIVVPASGSLVLGLAFIERVITADEVFDAMRVEEKYKAEIYNEELHGQDPAQEKKDQALLRDIKSAEMYLKLA